MPRVKDVHRKELDVGDVDARTMRLTVRYHVTSWHMDIDEEVLWDLTIMSTGPQEVRAVMCKPFTTDPWQIIGYPPNPFTFKPDNEDLFVFPQIKDANGVWQVVDGPEYRSDMQVLSEGSSGSGVRMTWVTQNIVMLLRAH